MKIKSSIVVIATCTFLCYWTAFGYGGGVFMKELKITQGYVTLVDDEDFDMLSVNKWKVSMNYGRPCAVTSTAYSGRKKGLKGHCYTMYMHRILMGVQDSNIVVDHIDRNPLNNQKHNLRVCTSAQNSTNTAARGGSSEFKGVCWHKATNKWYAQIRRNNKAKYLGVFKSEIDAAIAYNKAAIEADGEFAVLNIIPSAPKQPKK